jgi:hypothetical protein
MSHNVTGTSNTPTSRLHAWLHTDADSNPRQVAGDHCATLQAAKAQSLELLVLVLVLLLAKALVAVLAIALVCPPVLAVVLVIEPRIRLDY